MTQWSIKHLDWFLNISNANMVEHSGKISQCLLSRVSWQLHSLSACASDKEVCKMRYVCLTQDTVYIVVPQISALV